MADIVKNPVSSAIYLEKKDAALLERLKKIHPVKDLFTGKTVWKDTLKGLVYRRLIGGIAWPAPDSYTPMTHLAVLAEERDEDFSTGHHTVHVIYEDMAPTIEEVLNIAVAKQSLLRCAEWVAPTHESEVIRIRQWEKDRMRHRLPRIRIRQWEKDRMRHRLPRIRIIPPHPWTSSRCTRWCRPVPSPARPCSSVRTASPPRHTFPYRRKITAAL